MRHEREITAVDVHPLIARLIEVRLAWCISLPELAERIGCRPGTLGKWERGKLYPSGKLLIKWVEVLGYELNIWPKR
jgi:transcriptional regulator with XRE-family HTH domain